MADIGIRVTFVNDQAAYRRWQVMGEGILHHVDRYARKRDGASHVVLLRKISPSEVERVMKWCRQQPEVVDVSPLTEAEFWAAPSNGI